MDGSDQNKGVTPCTSLSTFSIVKVEELEKSSNDLI